MGFKLAHRAECETVGNWQLVRRTLELGSFGINIVQIAPGEQIPEHDELDRDQEEIFYVLGGEGLLWQDGETFAVAPGDCIVHRPMRGVHTLRAGGDGLDVLAFGQRLDTALTALPRAATAWSGARWLDLGGGEGPFAREAAVGAPECPPPSPERPANVVSLDAVPGTFEGRMRRLGQAAGARLTGLNHVTLAPGEPGAPAHCHSLEEEAFVVLDGGGVLELWQRGACEEQALSAGDVIARPAGTGVAHAFRAGERGLTYLAYGTREPNDMCFYPGSGRVSLRGLGVALSSPDIDYL